MGFGTIEQAIADIRDGRFVIVADDEDRENEGDLICAAELVSPEMVNFMIKRAGGLIDVSGAHRRPGRRAGATRRWPKPIPTTIAPRTP